MAKVVKEIDQLQTFVSNLGSVDFAIAVLFCAAVYLAWQRYQHHKENPITFNLRVLKQSKHATSLPVYPKEGCRVYDACPRCLDVDDRDQDVDPTPLLDQLVNKLAPDTTGTHLQRLNKTLQQRVKDWTRDCLRLFPAPRPRKGPPPRRNPTLVRRYVHDHIGYYVRASLAAYRKAATKLSPDKWSDCVTRELASWTANKDAENALIVLAQALTDPTRKDLLYPSDDRMLRRAASKVLRLQAVSPRHLLDLMAFLSESVTTDDAKIIEFLRHGKMFDIVRDAYFIFAEVATELVLFHDLKPQAQHVARAVGKLVLNTKCVAKQ